MARGASIRECLRALGGHFSIPDALTASAKRRRYVICFRAHRARELPVGSKPLTEGPEISTSRRCAVLLFVALTSISHPQS